MNEMKTFDNGGGEGFAGAARHHFAQLVRPQSAQDVPHQLRKHQREPESKTPSFKIKLNFAATNYFVTHLAFCLFYICLSELKVSRRKLFLSLAEWSVSQLSISGCPFFFLLHPLTEKMHSSRSENTRGRRLLLM